MPHETAGNAWQPFSEPLYATLLRTITIALVAATLITWLSHGRIAWSTAGLMALWPSFGGHWVELWFLNWLRPRLPNSRAIQVVARVATWLVAGAIFVFLMQRTATLSPQSAAIQLPLLVGALGFIGIELIVHLGLQLRGRASFYNARG